MKKEQHDRPNTTSQNYDAWMHTLQDAHFNARQELTNTQHPETSEQSDDFNDSLQKNTTLNRSWRQGLSKTPNDLISYKLDRLNGQLYQQLNQDTYNRDDYKEQVAVLQEIASSITNGGFNDLGTGRAFTKDLNPFKFKCLSAVWPSLANKLLQRIQVQGITKEYMALNQSYEEGIRSHKILSSEYEENKREQDAVKDFEEDPSSYEGLMKLQREIFAKYDYLLQNFHLDRALVDFKIESETEVVINPEAGTIVDQFNDALGILQNQHQHLKPDQMRSILYTYENMHLKLMGIIEREQINRREREYIQSNPEVYQPSKEFVAKRISPYTKNLQKDIRRVLKYCRNLDLQTNSPEQVYDTLSNVVEFCADQFDIKDIPKLLIKRKPDGSHTNGLYQSRTNTVTFFMQKQDTAANAVNIIAHECWHAHQFQKKDKYYEINHRTYIKSENDYDAYRSQLVEQEAFAMGTIFEQYYQRVSDKDLPSMLRKFFQKDQKNKHGSSLNKAA